MKIRVFFFGRARDLANGRIMVDLELNRKITLRELFEILGKKVSPKIKRAILDKTDLFVVSVNYEHVGDYDIKLKDGDTVAVLQPDAGG